MLALGSHATNSGHTAKGRAFLVLRPLQQPETRNASSGVRADMQVATFVAHGTGACRDDTSGVSVAHDNRRRGGTIVVDGDGDSNHVAHGTRVNCDSATSANVVATSGRDGNAASTRLMGYRKTSLHSDRLVNSRGPQALSAPQRRQSQKSFNNEDTCPFNFSVYPPAQPGTAIT